MSRARGLPARPILAIGVIAAALVCAWQAGVHQARNVRDQDHASPMQSVQGAEERIAQLIEERDLARAEAVTLRERLSEATRVSADEQAELQLYRRISDTRVPVGLGVDKVRYSADNGRTSGVLDVTVVQSRGRGRVAGELRVSLMRDGEALQVVDAWPDGSALVFDLRFFETLGIPLELAETGEPDAVVVEVMPDGDRHDDVSVKRAWNLVAK